MPSEGALPSLSSPVAFVGKALDGCSHSFCTYVVYACLAIYDISVQVTKFWTDYLLWLDSYISQYQSSMMASTTDINTSIQMNKRPVWLRELKVIIICLILSGAFHVTSQDGMPIPVVKASIIYSICIVILNVTCVFMFAAELIIFGIVPGSSLFVIIGGLISLLYSLFKLCLTNWIAWNQVV
jgi:hypothetical protein